MPDSSPARDAAMDEALAASPHRARVSPWPPALLGAAVWLGLGAALVFLLGRLPAPWRVESLSDAALIALAITLPFAGALGWASLAARAAETDRRLDAVGRSASRAARSASLPRAATAEDMTREELVRALSSAARDALDRERSGIARQLAELGETQRRLDLAVAGLTGEPPVTRRPAAAQRPDGPAMPDDPAGVRAMPADPAAAPPPAADPVPDPAPAPAIPTPDPVPAAQDVAAIPAAPAPDVRRPASIPLSPPPAPAEDLSQPSLPLTGSDPSEPARDWSIIATALDFPKDERDDAGWHALTVATRDRPVAELLQASEDALTILAQHGIYMEDLPVRHAPSALWSRFATGERGPAVAPVGGIEAEEAVETVRRLMKSDPVFRDTGMHLMRRYDTILRRAAAEPRGEGRLVDLADSRTGRAFMLVAQSVGAFD